MIHSQRESHLVNAHLVDLSLAVHPQRDETLVPPANTNTESHLAFSVSGVPTEYLRYFSRSRPASLSYSLLMRLLRALVRPRDPPPHHEHAAPLEADAGDHPVEADGAVALVDGRALHVDPVRQEVELHLPAEPHHLKHEILDAPA